MYDTVMWLHDLNFSKPIELYNTKTEPYCKLGTWVHIYVFGKAVVILTMWMNEKIVEENIGSILQVKERFPKEVS